MWFQRVVEDTDADSEGVIADRSGRASRRLAERATGSNIHPGDFQRVKLMMKLDNSKGSSPYLDTEYTVGKMFDGTIF
jgi:hypothetical protein